MAIILGDLKQHAEAEQRFLETLEILKKVVETEHREYFTTRSNLGDVFRQQGKFSEAIAIWEETNEQKRKHYGDRNTIYLNFLNMLADLDRCLEIIGCEIGRIKGRHRSLQKRQSPTDELEKVRRKMVYQ